MKKKSYLQVLKEDILQNKALIVCAVFVGILCFGFTITNSSIGIDDMTREYYLYSNRTGSLIQQGRLLHVAINLLTDAVAFIPFFTEFTGASLYVMSALLYCGLFQYITDGKLSLSALAGFACVYISSSILVEKFVFQLDVIAIMVSYCCSAVALLLAYRFVKEKKWWLFVEAVALLMISIGSYESFIPYYFCGVFAVFILEIVINKEKKPFWNLLLEGLCYGAILCAALVGYYGLVVFVQLVTDQYGNFVRYTDVVINAAYLLNVTKWIAQAMQGFLADRYVPILVFCAFSVIGAVLSIYYAVRRKNVWLILCYIAFWLGNFIIHYANGFFMCRAAQTFCLFVGTVVLLLMESLNRPRIIKQLLAAAMALLVFWQSADMNRWFYTDYIRYQKEAYVIDTIATKLLGGYDISKPVVFTNPPEDGYLRTKTRGGANC